MCLGPGGANKKSGDKKKKWWEGAAVLAGPLVGGVDVLGLGHASQLVLVARQAAEEDGAADAQDGGAPAEAVRPGVVVVALEDQLVELDRVDDQRDDLQHHCGGGEGRNGEWVTESEGGAGAGADEWRVLVTHLTRHGCQNLADEATQCHYNIQHMYC